MPSSPVVYSQQPEYVYQPADGGSVPPALPFMEDTTPEVQIHQEKSKLKYIHERSWILLLLICLIVNLLTQVIVW